MANDDEAARRARSESDTNAPLLTAAEDQDCDTSVVLVTPEPAGEQSDGQERDDSAPRQPKKRARSQQQHATITPAAAAAGVGTGTSRRLAADAKALQFFRVGGLKERHSSWRDLALYLSYYTHATQTHIEASDTVSFSQQNAVLQAAQASRGATATAHGDRASGRRQRLFPESSDAYARTFACRGPPHQELDGDEEERNECPFRFVAHVARERDAWRIIVPSVSQRCFHNHAVVGGLRVPRSVVASSIRTSMKQAQRRASNAVSSAIDPPQVLESDCGCKIVRWTHVSELEPEQAHRRADTEKTVSGDDRDEDGAACAVEEDDGGDDDGMHVTLESNTVSTHQALQVPPSSHQPNHVALKEYYESWDELFGVVDEYMHVTCTKLVLRASCSVAKHNKTVLLDSTRRAKKQVRSGGNQHLEMVPETWKMVSRQYGCTRGWTLTHPAQGSKTKNVAAAVTRSAGERCQFRIRAILVKVDNGWRIHLPVHMQNRVHNHSLRTIFSLSSGESAAQNSSITALTLFPDPGSQIAAQAQPHHHQPTNNTTGLPLPATHLKESHESWDDFFAYLRAYVHSTKVNIVIKHTTSASTRNQEILESGHASYLVPESLKTFAHRFGCSSQAEVHPGAECPFRFTAHVIKVDDAWRIHVPISLQSCRHDHTGSSAVMEQSHQPVVAMHANLLDIRTIPRDHPLYDAICKLASRQHHQQQQTMTMSPVDCAAGVPIAPTRSIVAHDTRLYLPVHQIPTQVLSVGSDKRHMESSLIPDRGEAVANTQSIIISSSSSDEENVEKAGDGQVIGGDTSPPGDIKGGGHEVRVASLQEFHASWESLSMYLHEYMRETKTKIVIGGSTSVSKRNQQMMQTQYAQRSEASILIPAELNVYYRRYLCTHGSEKRVRSQGLRQTRHMRSTGCKFQFSAHAAKINTVWCVHVPLKSQCCVHNHPVEQEQFDNYALFRMIPKVHPLYDEIREMVLAGSNKTAGVYEFIRANSSFKVTKKDVRNMIQTFKKG